MRKPIERLLFSQIAFFVLVAVPFVICAVDFVREQMWASRMNAQRARAQGYITCWDEPDKSIPDGRARYFDCNADGLVDGVRANWSKTIFVATQNQANDLRRTELQAALQYRTFESLCGDGRLDRGAMTTDSNGYPYVRVCGELVPTPGHPLWIRWLGRNTPDGQAAQSTLQRLKARQRAASQHSSTGRSQQ